MVSGNYFNNNHLFATCCMISSNYYYLKWWHDVEHSLWGVPVRRSLCLFWRETHTNGLCAESPMRPKGRGKESPREQSAEGSSRDQSAEGGLRRWKQGREERRTEVRKTTAKTCWPTEAGLTNMRRCQHCLWLCKFSLVYTLTLARRMHKKCHGLPPSYACS